ncbi:MAG TPA: EamA family transporter [Thermoanaerobaculia bacterium]|nr:EamA family transporter [Thermoanaerobaculia bacterium]
MKRGTLLAYLAFGIVCVVWGTTYLAIRVGLETIPPLAMTALRFGIAGAIMLIIARARGEQIPRDARTLREIAIVGLLMVGVGNLAVVWAEQWVPSGTAALFVATAPFWMAILEAFRTGGERLDRRSGLGMLIGFAGVALLVRPEAGEASTFYFVLGALVIQIGSIGWQLGSLRGKYHVKNVPLMTSAALQMLAGGIAVGLISLLLGEPARFSLNTRTFAALAYLTLLGSVVAYSAYVYALAHLRTSKLSLYAYVNPVIAVIAGWLILDEQLTLRSVMAMAIILGGVAMVQSNRFRTHAVRHTTGSRGEEKTAA